jgi:hypothetical protein
MVGQYLPNKPKFTFCYSALKTQIFLTSNQDLKLLESVNYLQSEKVAELYYSAPSTSPLLLLNPNPTNNKFLIPQI